MRRWPTGAWAPLAGGVSVLAFAVLSTVAFVLLSTVAFALPSPAAGASGLTYDQAVDSLTAQGYPQTIENHLCGLGTSALGFRNAGSSSDNAAASYIHDEMIAAGLADVRLESVPVDVTEFHAASVTVGGRVMAAVPWVGVPGTTAPITADVVYVHSATRADMDAAGNVAGKICLVDYDNDDYNPQMQGAECSYRGASAMILTRARGITDGLYGATGALGGMDGCWNLAWGPMLFVSQVDGDWLKSQLAQGPVTATFQSDVRVRLGSDGGVGYNVVGEIPGSAQGGQAIVVTAHHDAHFYGGVDNTSSIAGMLLMAKAMKMSGYSPARSIVFMATTGEEGGQTNAYYDWLYGAYYAVTSTHRHWPGKVVCDFNFEMLGHKRAPVLWAVATPELSGWYRSMARRSASVAGPYATVSNIGEDFAQSDSAAFTAVGIPSICLQTPWRAYYYDNLYHTQFDTPALVDYSYLARNMKFIRRLIAAMGGDRLLLPYDLAARARQLVNNVNTKALRRDGADPRRVARLSKAMRAFRRAAAGYAARRATIPRSRYAMVDGRLIRLEVVLNKAFTAVDVWDNAIYPQGQVQYDVENLSKAIADLGPTKRPAAARAALEEVSLNYYGTHFDYAAYRAERARHLPHYAKLNFGGIVQLAPFVDIMPQYREVDARRFARARSELRAVRRREVNVLNARLVEMARALASVTPKVRSLR